MTQIYVVCASPSIETGGIVGPPTVAYSDYPSALTYAQSIFEAGFFSQFSARDLVFMVNLTPSSIIGEVVNAAVGAVTKL